MQLHDVEEILFRNAAFPMRLVKSDGKSLQIPWKGVAVVLDYGVIVFKGVPREGSRQAKGYEVVGFDRIERIEPIPKRTTTKRKRKSDGDK